MTKAEENKFSMYEAVLAVLEKNSAAVNSLPVFSGVKTNLTNLISQITAKSIERTSSIAGKTAAKESNKSALVEKLIPLSDSLSVYGRKINSEEIKAKTKLKAYQLHSMNDAELLNKAELVRELLAANLEKLSEYGITEVKVKELTDKVAEYRLALDSKNSGFASKSALRLKLSDLFDEVDEILKKETDRLMENFKSSNKQFYDEYKSARVIWDRGGKKTEEKPVAVGTK